MLFEKLMPIIIFAQWDFSQSVRSFIRNKHIAQCGLITLPLGINKYGALL